uniref:Plasmid replication initiation protein n=1 Tax=Edwardsiella piscicida TaxID=1263550 RepID=A0A8F5Z8X1_EDWPI|nr:plasmid replication initiation protein [Edwardsiella piscicida]
MRVGVGIMRRVTQQRAAVGLNGGFVHTVQLGANCLNGIECQAWYENTRP